MQKLENNSNEWKTNVLSNVRTQSRSYHDRSQPKDCKTKTVLRVFRSYFYIYIVLRSPEASSSPALGGRHEQKFVH